METTVEQVPFMVCISAENVLVKMPADIYNRLAAAGRFTLTFNATPTPADWLTVADAARIFIDDVDAGHTLATAHTKISRAIDRGKIVADKSSGRKMIDRSAFALWCQAERRKINARENDQSIATRIERVCRDRHIDDDEIRQRTVNHGKHFQRSKQPPWRE